MKQTSNSAAGAPLARLPTRSLPSPHMAQTNDIGFGYPETSPQPDTCSTGDPTASHSTRARDPTSSKNGAIPLRHGPSARGTDSSSIYGSTKAAILSPTTRSRSSSAKSSWSRNPRGAEEEAAMRPACASESPGSARQKFPSRPRDGLPLPGPPHSRSQSPAGLDDEPSPAQSQGFGVSHRTLPLRPVPR